MHWVCDKSTCRYWKSAEKFEIANIEKQLKGIMNSFLKKNFVVNMLLRLLSSSKIRLIDLRYLSYFFTSRTNQSVKD